MPSRSSNLKLKGKQSAATPSMTTKQLLPKQVLRFMLGSQALAPQTPPMIQMPEAGRIRSRSSESLLAIKDQQPTPLQSDKSGAARASAAGRATGIADILQRAQATLGKAREKRKDAGGGEEGKEEEEDE